MQLLELELENFKSFKGRRTIPFDTGFTCITGPNGSGKSNITDAILFMLIPRSAKPLRASNLRELIFNGGKHGTPATECRVTMTFDNHDRELAVESDRVTLTRGVRCKGPNNIIYYRINDRRATAGEIEALLARAGLYAEGYNIIQQGHVMRTSMMSPLDRRRRLEDVAGITAYDRSLHRTRTQRRAVGESLDILALRRKETQQRLTQLEREKRDAERLEQIIAELGETARLLRFREAEDLAAELADRHGLAERYCAEVEKLERDAARLQQQAEETAAALKATEAEIAAAGGDEARELVKQLDLARVAEAVARQAASQAGTRLAELEATRLELRESHREAGGGLAQLQRQREALDATATRLAEAVETDERELVQLETAAATDSRAVAGQRETVEALRAAEGELANRRHRLAGELKGLERQHDELAAAMAQVVEIVAGARADAEEADWALKDLRVGRDSASTNLRKLKAKLTAARTAAATQAAEVRELERSVQAATVQHASLVATQKAHDEIYRSYGRAEQALLAARDRGELRGLVGTVAELGDVDQRYETALQVTAGRRLQSLVTEDDGAAAKAIAHLKAQRLGRARFLPLNRLRQFRPSAAAILVSRQAGAVGFAIDLVRHDPRYRNAFGNVFGDTVIMETLEHARPLLGRCRMVTLDGELLEAGGAMVGGTRPRGGPAFGGVDRGELERAEALLRDLEAQLGPARRELARTEEEAQALDETYRSLESEYSTSQTRLSDYDGRVGETRTRLRDADERLAARERDRDALDTEIATHEGALAKLGDEAAAHAAELAAATARLDELTGGTGAARQREVRQRLEARRGELAGVQSDLAALEATLAGRRDEVARLSDELAANEAAQQTQQAARIAEAAKAEQLGHEVAALRKREKEGFQKLEGLRERRDTLHDRHTELRTRRAQRRERQRERRNAIDDLDLEIGGRERRLAEVRAQLPEGAPPEKLPPREKLESRRDTLQQQRERLGNVNMLSLEHYRAEEERLDELKRHSRRLRGEMRRLERLEEKISTRREIKFKGVFEAVNANLREIFGELAGGGEAWLELENPKAPLEGGVRLMVRMPRKRLYSVEALSGGEKSIVSMAFIFAIQRHDPSPFYLLDEIDMNLDGVNTEHVGHTISLQSTVAQFIVVTLHHATLRECNHVLGVFMDDRGLSNVRRIPNVDEFLAMLPVEAEEAAA